ncbi:TGM1 glutamyltransferase, partial [Aegotheles bennettii]|nr:TGM1 glutamyltransferase [Aegotheles bennettii]
LCAVRYTGVADAPFRQEQHRRTLPPGQGEDLGVTRGGDTMMGSTMMGPPWVVPPRWVPPRWLLAPAVVGQETPIQVVFQNPLPETLSGATLRMEGAGFSCPKPMAL